MKYSSSVNELYFVGNIESYLPFLESGDILFHTEGHKTLKWEIVEIMQGKFYAVDNDRFGWLFESEELQSGWSFSENPKYKGVQTLSELT